jgi:hypothetical protein
MSQVIFAPVFALGKAHEQALGTDAQEGATEFYVSDLTGIVIGQHAFLSDADGSAVEYVGRITAKNALIVDVTVQFPLLADRAADAKFWVAAASWQAVSVPGVGDWANRVDPGLQSVASTGAENLFSRTRDAREIVTVGWQMISVADWQACKVWLHDNASYGLGAFTAAWKDYDSGERRCARVKLENPERLLQAQTAMFGWRGVSMEFAVAGDAEYL